MKLFQNIDLFTLICTLIIVGAAVGAYFYIRRKIKQGSLIAHRRKIEQIPSFISTLGVLGTFLGITIGLLDFDTDNLDHSIPLLLDGLKTAFFTSLAGMLGSLVLSRYISEIFDGEDKGISDVNMAAGEIVKAVKAMSESNRETLERLKEETLKQANNQTTFYLKVGEVLDKIASHSEQMSSNCNSLVLQAQSQTNSLGEIHQGVGNMVLMMGNVEEKMERQIESGKVMKQQMGDVAKFAGEIADLTSGIASVGEDVCEEVKQFDKKLHAEAIEIEDKMAESNELMSRKFDEFTELLKKSNTEALVEVMKNVTEQFQKSMNELINKLIQENFEQLNTSVERLNTWQQDNKKMIEELTVQYHSMAHEFSATSTVLSQVGTDTRMLVSDGGKLNQIVEALNKVMIEDEKFVTITTSLSDTVTLTKDNMTQFDKATQSLNDWVRKQRNFVDGVQLLIEKLDELNKLRDYNEQFWQTTKRSLEEGVGYITQGSQTLNQQLTRLDERFYARLSATLAELDTCIQAMVKQTR